MECVEAYNRQWKEEVGSSLCASVVACVFVALLLFMLLFVRGCCLCCLMDEDWRSITGAVEYTFQTVSTVNLNRKDTSHNPVFGV